MPIDIVLVDDHKLVRDGVRTILERGAECLEKIASRTGTGPAVLCGAALPADPGKGQSFVGKRARNVAALLCDLQQDAGDQAEIAGKEVVS